MSTVGNTVTWAGCRRGSQQGQNSVCHKRKRHQRSSLGAGLQNSLSPAQAWTLNWFNRRQNIVCKMDKSFPLLQISESRKPVGSKLAQSGSKSHTPQATKQPLSASDFTSKWCLLHIFFEHQLWAIYIWEIRFWIFNTASIRRHLLPIAEYKLDLNTRQI